jgi:S-adenosylmethionine/arginine decarboxylase-like enzyme
MAKKRKRRLSIHTYDRCYLRAVKQKEERARLEKSLQEPIVLLRVDFPESETHRALTIAREERDRATQANEHIIPLSTYD